MAHFVAKLQPKTAEQLQKMCSTVWWKGTKQDYIKGLFDSMGRRLDSVILTKGGNTKY